MRHPAVIVITLLFAFSTSAFAEPGTRPPTQLRGRQDSGPPRPTQPRPEPTPQRDEQAQGRRTPDRFREPEQGRRLSDSRETAFHIFCTYEKQEGRPQRCHTAALLRKTVRGDGEELLDNSALPRQTHFEAECDGALIFNGAAQRFTDHMGTRLQPETGPYPATVLPEGALRAGRRRSQSVLELPDAALSGHCQIYETAL